jgi:hypothetical protein
LITASSTVAARHILGSALKIGVIPRVRGIAGPWPNANSQISNLNCLESGALLIEAIGGILLRYAIR